MPKRQPTSPTLSLRALNRAYLARQHLLARTGAAPAKVLEHLVGIQSQLPSSAYFGLWSRVEGFTPDALSRLILARRAVRIVLMRGTIHLVTARDSLRLRPLVQPVLDRGFQGNWAKRLNGVSELDAIASEGRALVESKPLTAKELGDRLAKRWPRAEPEALANLVRARVPLVQVPPRGLWGQSGQTTLTSTEAWLGKPLERTLSLEALFLRYLAAFGPATPRDAQIWSGVSGFAEVAERLRPKLVTFTGPSGRELFDLPEAPRPDEDTPAPIRLVAEFDNLLLSHDDRSRVVDEVKRRDLMTLNGIFPGTVLVDGFVRAKWKFRTERAAATLHVTPYERITKKDRAGIDEEAERLFAFAAPDAKRRKLTYP